MADDRPTVQRGTRLGPARLPGRVGRPGRGRAGRRRLHARRGTAVARLGSPAALPRPSPARHRHPAAHFGLLAAFNLVREDRASLARSLRDLTDEARALMEGHPPERRDTAYPPAETGILGPDGRTDGLAVTLSVGASLFDDRFGLADRRPRELVRMLGRARRQ
jgi:deferrochelatase/peroxidase EfeB